MFSHLSASSLRVLRAAEQECRNRNQYYIGVEHVMLALLEDGDPEVNALLEAKGAARSDFHRDLRRAVGVGEERQWDGILITPRARAVFEVAERAAAGEEVRPRHLFDAIVQEGGLPADLLLGAATSPSGPQ
jgi:ATP-dependent Clp protease ATP-binding subunit ClpA